MKQSTYLQIRVVKESDPEQFQSKVNEIQIELADKSPVTTYSMDGDHFKAIIQYTLNEMIPETAEDQAYLDGLRLTCADCPHFEREKNADGSPRMTSKHGKCIMADNTRTDANACEWFYRKTLKGGQK